MNILSLTYEYPPIGGGGSAVAAALNEELSAAGDRVRVVTSQYRELPAHERVNDVDIHRAACWRRHRHYTTAAELATTLRSSYRLACRLIEQERPDIIHAHFVLPTGWVARRLARRYGIPYMLTAHGSDIPGYNPDRFEHLHRLLLPWWKRIVGDAAALVSPSHYLASLLQRSWHVPVQVIPNGLAAQPAQQAPIAKRNLALAVARLFPRKGVEHFIDAVQDIDTDWEFVVAGDGPRGEELRARARRRGGKIRFVGFVDRGVLRNLYARARIMVFPSLRENFPVVLLEAMDAGCAVITTDAEGCAEVVGDAGVVVPCANRDALRDALVALMHDPERCAELGARALARVEGFRWPRLASLYRDCYQAVLEGRAPAIDADAAAALGAQPMQGRQQL